jgi:hypothetical protein
MDLIKIMWGMDWINVAQERDQRWALVGTEIHLRNGKGVS